jgi:hypothetical protein
LIFPFFSAKGTWPTDQVPGHGIKGWIHTGVSSGCYRPYLLLIDYEIFGKYYLLVEGTSCKASAWRCMLPGKKGQWCTRCIDTLLPPVYQNRVSQFPLCHYLCWVNQQPRVPAHPISMGGLAGREWGDDHWESPGSRPHADLPLTFGRRFRNQM